MTDRSLRHKIVTGSFSLPVTALVVSAVWGLDAAIGRGGWEVLLLTALITYFFVELNNRYALLRVRSRMIGVSYLVLAASCLFGYEWRDDFLAVPALIASYFLLFASYRRSRPEGLIFYTFLLCGLGSLCFPPLLLAAAGYYVSMLFQLRNFTWRTFAAGLFGLILPYLFNSVYIFFRGDWTGTMRFFNDYTTLPDAEDLLRMFNAHVLTIAAVGTLTLFAFIHFFHTSYNDKIKTRIFYYVAATQEVLLTAAVVLFPAKFDVTFSLWAANSALFLGRYYALGRGRLFNFWFYLSGILMVLLAAVNRLPL